MGAIDLRQDEWTLYGVKLQVLLVNYGYYTLFSSYSR